MFQHNVFLYDSGNFPKSTAGIFFKKFPKYINCFYYYYYEAQYYNEIALGQSRLSPFGRKWRPGRTKL